MLAYFLVSLVSLVCLIKMIWEEYSIIYIMEVQWATKYCPATVDDIIGNKVQLQTIDNWFNALLSGSASHNALFFTGPPGTSKSTVADCSMKKYGYTAIKIRELDLKTADFITSYIEQLTKMLERGEIGPFGLIFDELESFIDNADKNGLQQVNSFFCEFKEENKTRNKKQTVTKPIIPVICICNNSQDKKLSDIKKECMEIRFYKPNCYELIQVIESICKQENFKIDFSGKKKLAEFSQGDYRRLIFILEHCYRQYKDTEEITIDQVYDFFEYFQKKKLDLNYYDITNKILSVKCSPEEILQMFESNKGILPMMIHENYINYIESQKSTELQKLDTALNTIKSISKGDLIEKMIYNVQGWHLHSILGLETCYLPNYNCNIYPKMGRSKCIFTKTLGKTSRLQSIKKNINQKLLPIINNGRSYSEEDIQYLADIILEFLLVGTHIKDNGISKIKEINNKISKDLDQYSLEQLENICLDNLESKIAEKPVSKKERKIVDKKLTEKEKEEIKTIIREQIVPSLKYREKGIEMMKRYNLTIEDIDKLIKINILTEKYRDLFNPRMKNELNKYYGHMRRNKATTSLVLKTSKSVDSFDREIKKAKDETDSSETSKMPENNAENKLSKRNKLSKEKKSDKSLVDTNSVVTKSKTTKSSRTPKEPKVLKEPKAPRVPRLKKTTQTTNKSKNSDNLE